MTASSPTRNKYHLSPRAAASLNPPPGIRQILQAFANAYDPKTNPDGIVLLGIAENALVSPLLTEHFNKHFKLDSYDLTYGAGPSGSHALQSALAGFLNTSLKTTETLKLEKENIHISSGASAVLDQLAHSVCSPGEGILLSTPYYTGFINDLATRAGVKPVLVDFDPASLSPVSGDTNKIVEKYEAALHDAKKSGTRVRAILVCNPHNPLGEAYPPHTIRALLAFARRHNIHYISDEIYLHSRYGEPETGFVSVYGLEELGAQRDMVHVVYGMSKDFGANGLRLGCLASHNRGLLQACGAVGVFSWPSSAAEKCWLALLENPQFLDSYFASVRSRLYSSWKKLQAWLEEHDIPYLGKERKGGYGFFVWCDLSSWLGGEGDRKGERVLTQAMLDGGVYLATGEAFGGSDGRYRITFSVDEQVMELGLKRLEKVLKDVKRDGGARNGVKVANGEVLDRQVEGLSLE